MNCSHASLIFNSCLKFDKIFGKKIICNWDKNSSVQYLRLGYTSSLARYFCSTQKAGQSQKDGDTVLLSPQEVTIILRKNEFNQEFTSGSVKSYDSNQLGSNEPIEDTRSEATCQMTKGMLLGVFDGHGGPACSQVVSKRLLKYIAGALLPLDLLKKYIQDYAKYSIIDIYNDQVELVEELRSTYENSFKRYLVELADVPRDGTDVRSSLQHGIMTLDRDFSREVIEPFKVTGSVNPKTLSVALSGAVVCVSHVDGPHLHVANVGDCNAVLGTMTEDNVWLAKKITREHNTENIDELKRIWNEHPDNEKKTIIRRDRLLGELAPLRSLGDYRYKWPVETLTDIAVPLVGPKAIPGNYHTPPYLSAAPDIYYHRLTPKDKFLIIASDGLWDMMTPVQAVKLVGEHMKGKVFFNPLQLPRKDIQLGDINELLLHRRESLKSKPKDRNAATHLIRHAIGDTEYGVDHARLSHLLSLAPDVSRMFRDDITVTVAYFDSEFLRQCPA